MKKIYFYIILVFFLLFLGSFIFNNFCYSKPAQKVIKRPIYHIVRKGECLYTIAKKYGISVRTLKRLNHLRSNIIRPGQRLLVRRIPIRVFFKDGKYFNSSDYIIHIVKKGETLYELSLKYHVPIKVLKKFNRLTSNLLIPGDRLKILVNNKSNLIAKLHIFLKC